MNNCSHCHSKIVRPYGRGTSGVVLVGEFPGKDELKQGEAFCGNTGNVLKSELLRLGVVPQYLTVMNMWAHKKNGEDACLSLGMQRVIEVCQDAKGVLLMGSDTVKMFCNESVMQVCGLRVESPFLNTPIIRAIPNPAIMFHKTIGEVRLGLYKLFKDLDMVDEDWLDD